MKQGADNLLDYTIPFVSLVKGERIVGVLERQFDGWNIDDMWVPMSCVSTDLTTAEIVVHRDGPTARAIRTSVAIPGVLPPVAHEGHLLADGGVLDNLPAGEFGRDPSVGVIIASDVAPPLGPSAKGDHGLSVSGWAVARQRVVPASLRRSVAQDPATASAEAPTADRLPGSRHDPPAVAADRRVAQPGRAPRSRDHRPVPRSRPARHPAARLQPRRGGRRRRPRAGSRPRSRRGSRRAGARRGVDRTRPQPTTRHPTTGFPTTRRKADVFLMTLRDLQFRARRGGTGDRARRARADPAVPDDRTGQPPAERARQHRGRHRRGPVGGRRRRVGPVHVGVGAATGVCAPRSANATRHRSS